MDQRLREYARRAAADNQDASKAITTQGERPMRSPFYRRIPWRWPVVFVALFLIYRYIGPHFLPDNVQQAVNAGKVSGTEQAAEITAAISARASDAAAVTSATEMAKVTPAVLIAQGYEAAKIEPTVAIERAKAHIELEKLRIANGLEIRKITAQQAVEAYQICLSSVTKDTARTAVDQITRDDRATFSESQFSTDRTAAQAERTCDALKAERDVAVAMGDEAALEAQRQIQELQKGSK